MEKNQSFYYPLLDVFRFFAAISIVWLHVAGTPGLERSKILGRFAVPFFTCTAAFLAFDALRRHRNLSLLDYFLNRFCRIYPLFLAWSIIYWGFRSASSVLLEHKGWIRPTVREFFLDGVAIQLWFLPFIIVATTAAFGIAKLESVIRSAKKTLAALLGIVGIFAAFFPDPPWIREAGYAPWLAYDALPALMWGIALGLLVKRHSTSLVEATETVATIRQMPRPVVPNTMAASGAIAFCVWLVLGVIFGRSILWENVAGLGLLLVGLNQVSFTREPFVAFLGSISFGVYLTHALFVEGLQHVLPRIGLALSSFRDGMVWLVSVSGSCTLVLALKRSRRWLAWLAG